ncbi:hypothetical protein [Dethiosulfatarculus sandiegensis]|uniref:Integrase catalytic domain-containing protein n=1 Tax=Dethiosulfatarculus sandiegensis TaxID=1429043 RepID=A0A0D2K230_9BACT|nr:hypothetical protein [Dethiosulfatarculus sandiegensis]KIX15730.1 hypothetical protein X474_02820 [Dethiosulfatarculus sandiegensis]
MRKVVVTAIYPKPRARKPRLENKVYPFLLGDMVIDRPRHVKRADIAYIPMRRGFIYLVAVMDRCSRRVPSRRVSNTLETDFFVAALIGKNL